MSSQKCPQCGLVNFATDENCKRCGASLQSASPTETPVVSGPPAERQEDPNALLRPCPACGHTVSLEATNCPQCGQPLKKKSVLTKDIGFAGGIYALIILAGLFIGLNGLLIGWIMLVAGAVLLAVRLRGWVGISNQ